MDQTSGTPTQQALTVDLCGIIRIFGKALYNEFGAIVRELVQNGHDSVAESFKRGYTAGDGAARPLHDYWVNVTYYNQAELVVADNGTGMSLEEIKQRLNQFGQSKKGDLRNELDTVGPDDGPSIIGVYGVGFLAAMAVSSRVDVWTQTANDPPVRWWYCEGETVAHTEFPSEEEIVEQRKKHGRRHESARQPGTVVVCRLSDDVGKEYDIEQDAVQASLVRYARLLRVPVYFNGVQISDKLAGWAGSGHRSEADWRAMIEETTGEAPLLVVPISSPPERLDLEGVLWIPQRQSLIGGYGSIDVYVRRLFVTQDSRLILPHWARFVMGMINSDKLNPLVSRSGLIEDKLVDEARELVTDAILAAFDRLAEQPEMKYWEVVGQHNDSPVFRRDLQWAVRNHTP